MLTEEQVRHMVELVDVLNRRPKGKDEPKLTDEWHTYCNAAQIVKVET